MAISAIKKLRLFVYSGVAIAVLVAAVLLLIGLGQPQKSEDEASSAPRVDRIFAERQPQYIDDARCAECHEEIYDKFRAHPMGRSLVALGELDADQLPIPTDGRAFASGDHRYDLIRRDGRIVHSETRLDADGQPLATTALPVAYAVGSAERGRSYIIDREGRLFMSPITWYPQRDRWDLSPGYEENNSHFNRPVVVQCLFCHANRAHPVEGTLSTYREPTFSGHAIGCQRCHGPGEDHVALQEGAATKENLGETIVNPARLAPKLREAVCQQCHLSGEAKVVRRGKSLYDFRPGMPLETVVRVFVDRERGDGSAKFVGHVEQMVASRCYEASDGKLGCISCHDPHEKPAPETRIAFYRARCLSCHQEQPCTESIEVRRAAEDNCMQCHMPSRGTEIRHAAITDHRIPRRPADAVPSEPSLPETPRTAAAIVPFQRPAERDADLRRDTALALLRAEDPETVELGEAVLRQIAVDLQDAVQQHPDDLAAWEGLGISMWRLGDPGRALQCFKASLRQAPRREFALMNAATLSAALRRSAEALQYWQQALAINPWIVRYRAETAAALASLGRWSDAETLCRETLEHFPESNRSRQVLIESLLAQRKHADADREFAAWLRFRPADPAQMRAWYENHPLRRQE